MEDLFDGMVTRKTEETIESPNSALNNDLERDIYNSLHSFKLEDERPYIDQLSKMISDYEESGYMTFLINFQHLYASLQGYLQKDNTYYGFIHSCENAVKYMLYETERDYIKELTDLTTFADIKEHIPKISIRIKNFNYDLSVPDISKAIPIRAANAASMSRLQTFKGVVITINQATVDVVKMKMSCDECGLITMINFSGELVDASKCSVCGKGNLKMIDENPITEDVQVITLHDINDAKSFATSVQTSLKCLVNQDLVNKVEIGDAVIVTGLPRIDTDDKKSKDAWRDKVKNNDYYVQMNSIRPRTGGVPFPKCLDVNYIEVNDADDFGNFKNKIPAIEELKQRPKLELEEQLYNSFCPQIYGHKSIKQGLLFALVGGIGRNTTGGKVDKRGNIHVMMISDPSVGKSEMLKYCAKLMKRGIFVSATSSTKVGLTGAAVRDDVSGKWMIEAGAILRANNGILCIDEIGQLPKDDQAALLEVAEQEQYTFAKAGILKTFPVNITLIVSGNPIDGRYNPDMSAAQNLGQFAAPFLSRFDEKYVFRDIPDEENDENIANHVLKQVNGLLDISGLIPSDLLAAYISYVRNCGIQPTFTDPAIKRITKWYSGKRKDADVNDMTKPAPLGVREMEGLTRMCAARARLLWQEVIDVPDVEKVIEIHDEMIYKVAYDPETGQVDASRFNSPKSSHDQNIDVKVMAKIEAMTDQNKTLRVDKVTFYSACKIDGVAKPKEIDAALDTFERIGKIKIKDGYIELQYS